VAHFPRLVMKTYLPASTASGQWDSVRTCPDTVDTAPKWALSGRGSNLLKSRRPLKCLGPPGDVPTFSRAASLGGQSRTPRAARRAGRAGHVPHKSESRAPPGITVAVLVRAWLGLRTEADTPPFFNVCQFVCLTLSLLSATCHLALLQIFAGRLDQRGARPSCSG